MIAEERALEALGNPMRRRILKILNDGPQPVGVIAKALPVSRPAVSKHLRVLEAAELVTYQKRGNRNVFELDRRGFEAARRWLEPFWDEALERFARIVEATGDDER